MIVGNVETVKVPMEVADTAMSIADAFHDHQKEIDEKTIKNLLDTLSKQTTKFYYEILL